MLGAFEEVGGLQTNMGESVWAGFLTDAASARVHGARAFLFRAISGAIPTLSIFYTLPSPPFSLPFSVFIPIVVHHASLARGIYLPAPSPRLPRTSCSSRNPILVLRSCAPFFFFFFGLCLETKYPGCGGAKGDTMACFLYNIMMIPLGGGEDVPLGVGLGWVVWGRRGGGWKDEG